MGGEDKIAMVGTPCQIIAATVMEKYSSQLKRNFPIDIKIGLFCMENFSYEYLKKLLHSYGIKFRDVVSCRIEGSNAYFHLINKDVISIPLSTLRKSMRKSCKICMDFTSELADISVGSVGSPKGWSTVIIRSEKGLKLVEKAKKAKYIETKMLDADRLNLIEKLAKIKKNKNLEEIKNRERVARPVMYWRIMPEEIFLNEVENYQFKDLKGDVIDVGACVLCGACFFSCPEDIIKIEDRKPEINGKCPPDCNACYIACPRSYVPDCIVSHEDAYSALGNYIEIISARSPFFKGQDGGVVTALLACALSEKIVNKVLIVDKDPEKPWKPLPILTDKIDDVVKASGTKYSVCPIFKALKE